MKILHHLPIQQEPTVVVLGNFDGVHQGHQLLITTAMLEAQKRNLTSVVLTFDSHPEKVLHPQNNCKLLLSNKKKSQLIAKLGVDVLVYLPFTKELAQYSPEEFARKVLVEALKAECVFVGFNYTFGKRASGDVSILSRLGQELGFEVKTFPPVKVNDIVVSSTAIRNALLEGKIELARSLLGYWPLLTGRVVKGFQKGRLIGFPTANLKIDDDLLLPQNGVYASIVNLAEKKYFGMTNIGRKPTVGKELPITVEVNIFDFAEDIYGQEIEVCLYHRIREERKFSSLEELSQQLKKDRQICLEVLNSLPDVSNIPRIK